MNSSTINSLGDVLEGAILSAGGKLEFPKAEEERPKILVAFLTGGDPDKLTLFADPSGVKDSMGSDHVITVMTGPTSNSVSSDYWRQPQPFKFKSHFVRLGQMYRQQDPQGRHTGVVVPRDVRAFKKYYHACTCGHVDLVSGLEAESRKFLKACRRCRRAYDGLGRYSRLGELADAESAACADADGRVCIEAHVDNDSIAKVSVGAMPWKSIPRDRLVVKHGDVVKTGAFLMSGWQELAPIMAAADNPVYEQLRQKIQEGRDAKFTERQEQVLPQLVGVFPRGTAPGAYKPVTDLEADVLGRYAAEGFEMELRPYKLLRGLPNLVCDWRWILPSVSVGWIPVASLYQAGPNADRRGQWNPGFRHELAILERRK